MLTGTPEEIFESTKSILFACKEKHGFVFGNSNAVVMDTPMENYVAMVAAWNEFAVTGSETV